MDNLIKELFIKTWAGFQKTSRAWCLPLYIPRLVLALDLRPEGKGVWEAAGTRTTNAAVL